MHITDHYKCMWRVIRGMVHFETTLHGAFNSNNHYLEIATFDSLLLLFR